MTLRVSPALRIVLFLAFIGIEVLVILVGREFARTKQLGNTEIIVLAAFALGALLLPILTRMKLVIGDNYVEYFSFLPGAKAVTIRAVDVDKIERSAAPFQGRVDYIRMKGGKELYTIFTDSMERRKELPALLEQALKTKIVE